MTDWILEPDILMVKSSPLADVKAHGATGDGVTDDTAAIQAALDSGAKDVFLPEGTYLISTALSLPAGVTIRGVNSSYSVIKTVTDIEIIRSSNLDSEFFSGAVIRDLMLQSTVAADASSYQIHLRNALLCEIRNVHTLSGLPDTPGSATDVAGIWLEKSIVGGPAGAGSYINRIEGNFIQNGGLLIDANVTDGIITKNFIYGHPVAHAIKFGNGAGNWLVSGNNISSPPSSAGIWISGGSIDHIRIVGNFFDGNPTVLDSGYGVWSDSGAPRIIVANNSFWAMGKSAVRAVDPVQWLVTGNTFLDCNDEDDSYSDVDIVGVNITPARNVVSSNSFQQQSARANPGYAIAETSNPFAPVVNTFANNAISFVTDGYLAAGTSLGNSSSRSGNKGTTQGDHNIESSSTMQNKIVLSSRQTLTDAAYIDLTVNATDYGFAGHLYVSQFRSNSLDVSRSQIYTIVNSYNDITIAATATQDGSAGGSTFTVTSPSNGVLRITNNSGQTVECGVAFIGVRASF